MTPRLEKALIAVLAATPPLLMAASGWLEARAQKEKKLELADNYQGYIEEQMQEDERLERALGRCMELLDGHE